MATPGAAGRSFLGTACWTLLVCGCAMGGGRASRPDPSPYLHRVPTVAEVIASLRAREEALESFRGQARLDYNGPDGTTKSSQMILVKAPDLVRIDVMSPFGPTYTVASDGHSLRAYDRGEKVMYVGAASATNLRTYARVSLDVDVLALLIRGLPPFVLGETKGATVAESVDGWMWQAELDGGGRMRIDLDRSSLRPLRAELFDPSFGSTVTVEFDRYEDVDGVDVPHRVSARLADGGSVVLQYARIWRSVGLEDSVFRIKAPHGVRVIDMGREAPGGNSL